MRRQLTTILILTLTLSLMIALAACGGGETPETGNTPQVQEVADPTPAETSVETPTPDSPPEATPNDNGGDNGMPPVQAVETITIKDAEYSTSLTVLMLGTSPDGGFGMALTNEDIEPLQYMTNLTELWLNSAGGVSDISPLSELTNLEVIVLEGNNINDISHLSGLTNLSYLTIRGNDTLISDISALSGLTNLTYLYMDSENQITDWSPVAHVETVIGRP